MAEGLAAVGLAGNILQFISFSSALVSKTRDIYQSASGVSSELVDLESVSASLKDKIRPFINDSNISPQLRHIVQRCNDVANELLGATAKLKQYSKSSTKGPSKWQSFRKALKCIWHKEQIDALRLRLQLLRDQLSLHLVSSTCENQTHVRHLLENWSNYVVHSAQMMTTQIEELNGKLCEVQQNTAHGFNDDDRMKLYDLCDRVRVGTQELSHRHTIVQSLRYDCMEVRNEAIKDAHRRTFDWMFAPAKSPKTFRQPTVAFTQWLESGSGIYWVTGKPGSGKSTLMKYLFNHIETTRHLRTWADAVPLVQTSFYFWIPGQQMQKSLKGLLQTLLYHILSACPDLVPILCPERSNVQHMEDISLNPWSLSELQKAFQVFRTRSTITTRFYFHIDGLDEYYGDSWDIIHTLQELAMCPNVKMCLSSRPWNSFQDAFGRSNPNVLRLHEWTKKDITIFAHESLMAYADYSDFKPPRFNDFIRDIAERAQGVFLWVRLVVHSLRDGLVNEDPLPILHERLRAIPTDLEDFFQHILESVEDVYQSRMARTFLAAIRTQEPLKTIHYHFLDQENIGENLDSSDAPWSSSKIQQVVHQTHRRLNGRFRGLLEPSPANATMKHPTVDFLHRTLRDFLKTERMVKWLEMRASTELNVLLAMARALLATQSVVNPNSCVDDLHMIKTAIELSSLAAKETGETQKCYAVVDFAHDLYQRADWSRLHEKCGINCYIVHFALTVGHVDYLHHCIRKGGAKVDINRIMKHALCCSLGTNETFSPTLSETIIVRTSQSPHDYEHKKFPTKFFGHDLSPSLIHTLLDLGADPNAIDESTSSWTVVLREAVAQMDIPGNTQSLDILEIFLKRCSHLDSSLFTWNDMLTRQGSRNVEGMRNTLRYVELFFSRGIDPNLVSQRTTLFIKFLRTLPNNTGRVFAGDKTAIRLQHDILLAFLRAGADVTQVYKDENTISWFPCFLRALSSTIWNDKTIIAEFRLFLKHGLNLNDICRGNITVWYRLLGVIHQSVQQDYRVKAQHQAIHQIMLLSIQHGANPYAPGLPRMLQWMRGRQCVLESREVAKIEKLLPSSALVAAGIVGRKRKSDDGSVSHDLSRTKKNKM